VLRETEPQARLWDALLPEEAKRLPAELAKIDAYLDDDRFLAPWRPLFGRRLGRPSVPVDTLLGLLYLKHRYGLGDERRCREVADSLSWRRCCRIGLDRPVPHPTTLVKLVGRAGPEVIGQLNTALVARLAADRVLRARRLRADTTVVEADIDDPTDVRPAGAGRPQARVGWSGAARAGGGPQDPVPGPGRWPSHTGSWPGRCADAPGWRWPRWTGSPPRSPGWPGRRCGRWRWWRATPAGRWPADPVTAGLHDW
jgi:IS5 family transposase